MTAFCGIAELGGLYRDGLAVPRATRPWIVDLAALCPYEGLPAGNIPRFSDAPDWARWRLGDTPDRPQQRLRWVVLEEAGRRLLICDRMILVYVSWRDLDDAGLVSGTQVEIDGVRYSCRLMTGGTDFRDRGNGYAGGAPPGNEWDRFILGEAGTAGLPEPAPGDRSGPLGDAVRDGGHNQVWNWMGAHSWTASPFARDPEKRCCRGYSAAGFFYLNTVDHRHEDIGWRPVLECPF